MMTEKDPQQRRRKAHVAANYVPLHREVYTLRDEFVDPRWRELVRMAREATAEASAAAAAAAAAAGTDGAAGTGTAGTETGTAVTGAAGNLAGSGSPPPTPKGLLMTKAAGLLKQRPRGVFSFPALTPHFCRLLREEKAS